MPSGTPGWNPETQVHLLAVSTWQTECSSRVVLTLGNNVCQLPDINIAPRSNSSVSKTWGRGKPNKISCQKLYFCQHYISSSIYQEGSRNGLLWCAKSNALFCRFRLAWPFLIDRILFFLMNPVISKISFRGCLYSCHPGALACPEVHVSPSAIAE